jgi:two-component system NtrC family sensor kinase
LGIYLRFQFINTLESRSELLLRTIAKGRQSSVDQLITNKTNALRSITKFIDTSTLPTEQEMVNLLALLQGMDETILDIGLFDHLGTHTRYAGPFRYLEGKNYKEENWFHALSTSEKEFYISDVYLGYRNEPHFIIAYKIPSPLHSQYLRITINPSRFNQMVSDVQVIEGASALIVNSKGACQCGPELICTSDSPMISLPVLSDDQGFGKIQTGKGSFLVAWSKMQTTDWTLVVLQDQAIANLPVQATHRIVLLILTLSTLLIVFFSVLSTQTLIARYARAERDRAKLIDHLIQAGKLSTMGEMAAGVAHEINNPLAVMLSEVGVMEDILDPAFGQQFDQNEFRERMNSIKQEIHRCRSITHKLLGFSRHHETRIDSYDINGVVKDAVGLIQKELTFENIEIILETDDQVPKVKTDAEKIKQVLLNLLRNAKDAIGKDGRITISTLERKKTVSIIVSDTGQGIDEKNLAKIFQPFFTTKEAGKGTGLGLSISHGIVTSLGGTLHVSSQVGKGTSFEIELPKT